MGPVHICLKCSWVFFFIFVRIFIDDSVRNSGDPDQTPRSVASDLGLQCLTMSPNKDARLIWLKITYIISNNGSKLYLVIHVLWISQSFPTR